VMHDVGKIGVRYDMLNKPGKLTPEEVAVFRQHPEKGKRILEPVPCLHGLIDGCWCHHEWFDGGGYPRGLSGQNIPIVGRIVAIADAYDAMTNDRPYKRAMSHQKAIEELRRHAGTQFDPELVTLFCDLFANVAPVPDPMILAMTAPRDALTVAHPARRRRRRSTDVAADGASGQGQGSAAS